jgi:hypothetical protein
MFSQILFYNIQVFILVFWSWLIESWSLRLLEISAFETWTHSPRPPRRLRPLGRPHPHRRRLRPHHRHLDRRYCYFLERPFARQSPRHLLRLVGYFLVVFKKFIVYSCFLIVF